MYICLCNGITDSQVRRCVREGACCFSDLQTELGVAVSCGKCADAATAILFEERALEAAAVVSGAHTEARP